MYAGRIVEFGSATDVLLRPRHPYTMGLLASILRDRPRDQDIDAIPGSPPDLRLKSQGCSFAPRCKFARPSCGAEIPPSHDIAPGHSVRCIRVEQLPVHAAPAVEPAPAI
jgi:peptide/nickel transport system ATP-binding protein